MCEYAEVSNSKIRKARKPHKCCECYRKIHPGEKYEYTSGIFEGDPFSHKTCLDCAEIYQHLWTLPETECIDMGLYDYLQESEYVDSQPHDEEFEYGDYCTITASVPWLQRINGYWKLVKPSSIKGL